MQFQVTFDYLCPFARNASEAILNGIEEGREWQPGFRVFSLAQSHVEEGEPAIWERPDGQSGLLALQWGVAVRDNLPELFPAVHRALFAARHDHGLDIKDENVLRGAVARTGADPDQVADLVASGTPLKIVENEHAEAVEHWQVFGVPTFIVGDEAVFIRFMERGRADDLGRALDLISWSRLNEFKRTRVPR